MPYVIHSVEGNRQRLDGGAMYGNVPRALWADWSPPDSRNRIELACRAFLIEDQEGRRVLLEAGIGVFFDPKLRERFGVEDPEHRLLASLAALGVEPATIDAVVLSHLHFDHAGGLLTPWQGKGQPHQLVFPKARFLVGDRAWQRARQPHLRDRASFVPELLELLEGSGRLELIEGDRSESLGPDFRFHHSDGHTPGLLLTELSGAGGSLVFCGDLIPGRPWLHLPITMGYDRFPELLIEEKKAFLEECLERGTRLLFTHDPGCALCAVGRDATGRFGPRQVEAEVRDLLL